MLRSLVLTFIVGTTSLLAPVAAQANWICKPVWAFSGMGEKVYSGAGNSERDARKSASDSCILDNRGLELDDFCLVAPKGNEWHCASEDQATTNRPSKS